MPWYPSNFYASTRTWPFIARAVYRELLDIEWDSGPLPNDPEALRSMLNVKPADWRTAWRYVNPKFELGEDGRLRNARLEVHRAKALALIEKRRSAANQRWNKNVIPLGGKR
jgi:hypothetical protein